MGMITLLFRRLLLGLAIGWGVILPLHAMGGTVDFESVPLGQAFGNIAPDPDSMGDVVLIQDGIEMSVEAFQIPPFVSYFDKATVGGIHQTDYPELFSSTPLELFNIGVRFDFSNATAMGGGGIDQVTIDYWEFGGTSNLMVNDQTLHVLTTISSLPTGVAPGVTALVTGEMIHLSGPITSLQIGGQELSIDNIVAVPEPTTLLLLGGGLAAVLTRRLSRQKT